MAGKRAFDDGRFPDAEDFADCFICGRKVDPLDPSRAYYDEPPAGPRLPIHAACPLSLEADPKTGLKSTTLHLLYRQAISEMTDVQYDRFVTGRL